MTLLDRWTELAAAENAAAARRDLRRQWAWRSEADQAAKIAEMDAQIDRCLPLVSTKRTRRYIIIATIRDQAKVTQNYAETLLIEMVKRNLVRKAKVNGLWWFWRVTKRDDKASGVVPDTDPAGQST
jgi:hypothetical protein